MLEVYMKRFVLAILVVVILGAVPVFARDSYYLTGDTIFSIRAGINFPTFLAFFRDPQMGTRAFEDTHLSIGGDASLAYQGFLNESFALGGQIQYVFNYSVGGKILTTVPLTAKLTYLPVQTGSFDLGISLNLGGAFIRYNEGKDFVPFASATITPSYYFSDNWGLGVESGLMVTLENYGKNNEKHNQSAFAAFMPVTLVLSYRH